MGAPAACRVLLCLVLAVQAVACTERAPEQLPEEAPENPLFVDPSSLDFSSNPKLLQRLLATPHGYFRFINIPFSQEVCRRFAPLLGGTPSFNLHGDAHIEQYAVTDLGRGMTDFDDSSRGPAILDLTRYGVSLSLAARQNGWQDDSERLLDEFLRGYLDALVDPAHEVEIPTLARRLQAGFKQDPEAYHEFVDSVMEAMPEEEADELVEAMQTYLELMMIENPELPREFFEITRSGYLKLGIGSALDLKFLVRLRGPSDADEDDVILELKQVRDLTGIDCISLAQGNDPFRILVGQARIAYQPYDYLGYLRFRDRVFWAHAWVLNYEELEIDESFRSVDEMAEVAYDVGFQLGIGHTKQIATPLDQQLRREQQTLLRAKEQTLRATVRELTELTLDAWERFGREASGPAEPS